MMLVDLDAHLGRVADYGSVKVKSLMSSSAIPVQHL